MHQPTTDPLDPDAIAARRLGVLESDPILIYEDPDCAELIEKDVPALLVRIANLEAMVRLLGTSLHERGHHALNGYGASPNNCTHPACQEIRQLLEPGDWG